MPAFETYKSEYSAIHIVVLIMACYDWFVGLCAAGRRVFSVVSEKVITHFHIRYTLFIHWWVIRQPTGKMSEY